MFSSTTLETSLGNRTTDLMINFLTNVFFYNLRNLSWNLSARLSCDILTRFPRNRFTSLSWDISTHLPRDIITSLAGDIYTNFPWYILTRLCRDIIALHRRHSLATLDIFSVALLGDFIPALLLRNIA